MLTGDRDGVSSAAAGLGVSAGAEGDSAGVADDAAGAEVLGETGSTGFAPPQAMSEPTPTRVAVTSSLCIRMTRVLQGEGS